MKVTFFVLSVWFFLSCIEASDAQQGLIKKTITSVQVNVDSGSIKIVGTTKSKTKWTYTTDEKTIVYS